MPTGDDLDSRDSVEERPLSAAKLSAPSEKDLCCLQEFMQLQNPVLPI